jgi:hypothetical protein
MDRMGSTCGIEPKQIVHHQTPPLPNGLKDEIGIMKVVQRDPDRRLLKKQRDTKSSHLGDRPPLFTGFLNSFRRRL